MLAVFKSTHAPHCNADSQISVSSWEMQSTGTEGLRGVGDTGFVHRGHSCALALFSQDRIRFSLQTNAEFSTCILQAMAGIQLFPECGTES